MIVVALGKELEVELNSLDDVVDEIVDRDLEDYVEDDYFSMVKEGVKMEEITLAGAFLALLYHAKANLYNEEYYKGKLDLDKLLVDIDLELEDDDYNELEAVCLEGGSLNFVVIGTVLNIKATQERLLNAEVLKIEEIEGDTEL